MRLTRLSGGWSDDPLWGSFYDWTVEHPRAGGALWAIGIQSDLRRLYEAADEIGREPDGARILDIPCGGGVALRGLRPDQDVEYVAADISRTMLHRSKDAARERGVADLVTLRQADVEALPFEDESYDLVVSFTGLHCFPDPEAATAEMTRVLRVGGVITGSALLNDTGLRFEPMRVIGRRAGLLGPGCTADDVRLWLERGDITDVSLEVSGAIAYFRGLKRPR